MKQVILNLFQNAIQHTDPLSGRILISVSKESECVVLTIKDNGIGMNADHLKHIYERFYRIDSSRSRIHGGAGLGLAITKSIVELHRGEIRVKSAQGAGSVFSVVLPLS
jgi:two-component system OmpR family sensor kinase